MKKSLLLLTAAIVILLPGCKKDTDSQTTNPDTPAGRHALLLNEGTWGGNNASISRIDLDAGTLTNDWFAAANGRGLGDLAQDLIHYGSKGYVTVSKSNTIEVFDWATGRSLKQISMGQREPRYLVSHEGKVYASCYGNSVVRLDTATLTVEASCPLSGLRPEQLCVAGGRLYVCNSWEYGEGSSTLYDSTLSVVDIASFAETGKVTVGHNPGKVKALDDSRLLVSCAGDYGSHPAQTLIVNTRDGSTQSLPIAATGFDVQGGSIYLYTTQYDAQWNPVAAFYRVDATTLQATSLGITGLDDAYGITLDPVTGHLLICDSPYNACGDLHCHNADGSRRWSAEGGQMPSKVVF